jgi:hypothetical protein
MELTDKDLEIMHQYFDVNMSETERNDFQKRLNDDADFKKTVTEYQATLAVLNTVRERQQKKFLKTVNAAMPPVEANAQYAHLPDVVPVRRMDSKWWAMTAVGLVLVAAGYWFFGGQKTRENSQKLAYSDYFEPYPALNATKGVEEKDKKTAAFDAYNAQKYADAAPLFSTAFIEKSDSTLLFYKAISELGSGETVKAEQHFEQLIGTNNVPQQALFYYLGLSAAENKESEKAILNLKKATYTEGSYKILAERILANLAAKK